MVAGSLTSLPSALLTKVLDALPSAADLAYASASCRELRQAACWRTAFARFYGEHSAGWAEVAAGGADVDFRALVAMRMSACVSRAGGRSHLRTLYYSFASNPVESEFLPSSMSLDGPYLALGDYSGAVSLWDLRRGRRLWRVSAAEAQPDRALHGLPEIGEVTAVHCCHLGGLFVSSHVSTDATTLTIWVRRFIDGGAVRRVLLFPGMADPALPHSNLQLPVLHVHLYTPQKVLGRTPARGGLARGGAALCSKLLAVIQDEVSNVPSPRCLTCLTFSLPGTRDAQAQGAGGQGSAQADDAPIGTGASRRSATSGGGTSGGTGAGTSSAALSGPAPAPPEVDLESLFGAAPDSRAAAEATWSAEVGTVEVISTAAEAMAEEAAADALAAEAAAAGAGAGVPRQREIFIASRQGLERSFAPWQGLMSEQAGVMAEIWVRPMAAPDGGGPGRGVRGSGAGGYAAGLASGLATDALAFQTGGDGTGGPRGGSGGVAGAGVWPPVSPSEPPPRPGGQEVCLRLVDVYTLRPLGAAVLWRRLPGARTSNQPQPATAAPQATAGAPAAATGFVEGQTAAAAATAGGAAGGEASGAEEVVLQACSLQWRGDGVAWLFVQEEVDLMAGQMWTDASLITQKVGGGGGANRFATPWSGVTDANAFPPTATPQQLSSPTCSSSPPFPPSPSYFATHDRAPARNAASPRSRPQPRPFPKSRALPFTPAHVACVPSPPFPRSAYSNSARPSPPSTSAPAAPPAQPTLRPPRRQCRLRACCISAPDIRRLSGCRLNSTGATCSQLWITWASSFV